MSDKAPLSTPHGEVVDKILNRLAEAEQPLPNSLEFYRRILIIQKEAKLPDLSDALTELKRKATERLSQGKPSVTFPDLEIDWISFQKLFNEVADVTSEFLSLEATEIEELKQTGNNLDTLKDKAKIWFGIKTLPRNNTTKSDTIKPLLSSILQATFYPFLAAYADALLPSVSQEAWYKRHCPVCGGSPDFAFLDKEKDGARWLLCSLCDALWLFYRLVCPHCSNDDQTTLAYFTDDANLYRLYVCEKCHLYLKSIDMRKTEAEIFLPLERILTLDLDRQAHESNYKSE